MLVFPGVFRGLLDAQSRTVNTEMMIAAARALAATVADDELNPNYIIPSVFHKDVAKTVAAAVRDAALAATTEAPAPSRPTPGIVGTLDTASFPAVRL